MHFIDQLLNEKKNPNVYLLHWNGHVCACSCSCINRVKKIECLYCTTPVPHQYQAMYLLTKYSLKYFLVEWSEYKSESPISWFVASQVGLVQENRRLKKYKSDVSRSWFDRVKYRVYLTKQIKESRFTRYFDQQNDTTKPIIVSYLMVNY